MSRRDHRRSKSVSSSSSSSTEEVFIDIKRRVYKKQDSDSSSSSEIECYSNDKSKKKKQHKSKKDSCSSESDEKCKKKKDCKSDSDSEKCTFEEVYKYYKYRLLTDDKLMAGGSTAYTFAYDNENEIIPRNFQDEFENIAISYNIDLPYAGAPQYVRESGVYILFFIIASEEAAQFAVFVNGEGQQLTRIGNNSGAGQLVLRTMLRLNKDDAVVIRNSESSSMAVESNTYLGGLQPGNTCSFLMMKIAPYDVCDHCDWDDNCLSKKKKHLFKKLLDKMLCDKELMLKGFNVHGTFYSKNAQSVLTEDDIVWDSLQNVNGLLWDPVNPKQVKVLEDGVYKLFALATTVTPTQISLTVNGVPIEYTTQGTNKGAGQVTLRTLLPLNKNDIVTVRNHTSANGKIDLGEFSGGTQKSVSAIITIFKIAPLCKPQLVDNCKLNKYYKKTYNLFREYLLNNKCLQVEGSSSLFSLVSDSHQKITNGVSVDWTTNQLLRNVHHTQGKPEIVIEQDGIYDIFFDILTNEPSQLTLFINGVADLSTTFGRESGGARCLMRQFIKLNKCDVLTVRNYESHSTTLTTSINAGGQLVGQSALFMAFRLSAE